MSEPAEFIIGSEVACTDGVCGNLVRVVIDPVARAVTHLVVEPRRPRGAGHLVPIVLVDSATTNILLRCTKAEFDALEDAQETQFLPVTGELAGYQQDQVLSLPFFGLGLPGAGLGAVRTVGDTRSHGPHPVAYDRVPVGEVEVRRGDHVDATDGAIGRVRGLVIDPSDHHVTHILLDEGHLWGEKTVAIPITAVTRVGEVIRLSLTTDEVRDLPSVDIDHRR
jgi:sporulation protein YlmC with PRC-barrel domain